MSFYYDLSTLARWSGNPVGITRVEQELARRLIPHFGHQGAYCVYDKTANCFRHVPTDFATDIIEGRASINFESSRIGLTVKSSQGQAILGTMRTGVRRELRRNVWIYGMFQRLRGRNFTRRELEAIKNAEFARIELAGGMAGRSTPLKAERNLADFETIALSRADTIVSGGLDWEHKDMRSIMAIKRRDHFRYVAVLYDLIPILYPHYVVPAYVTLLRDYFGELVWLADGLLCILSNAIRNCPLCVSKNCPHPRGS